MATRETAAQRKSRLSALIADFDARNRELNKLLTIVKGLKAQIKEIEPGTYGDWVLAFKPGRQIVDAQALATIHAEKGITVPMRTADDSIVVTPKAAR
jgi:hypothetical protein